MGIKLYIKRAIKYILKEYKPVIIKAEIIQKTPSQMMENKRILITGGGKGLGFFMAKKLIQEGAEVIITGRDIEQLNKAKKELGNKAKCEVFDVTDVNNANNFLDKIYSRYGKIDCLINNAGVSLHEKEMKNVTIDGYNIQMDTNLKGAYFLAQAFVNKFEKSNGITGNIIFISSERGNQSDDIPYGLTKVALNSLTQGMSRRLYKKGIRVNAVAPGITASNMTNIDKTGNLYCDYNASGRYFLPEEVAEVVCFLASDVSKCISGEIIHCDAGNHLNPWFSS